MVSCPILIRIQKLRMLDSSFITKSCRGEEDETHTLSQTLLGGQQVLNFLLQFEHLFLVGTELLLQPQVLLGYAQLSGLSHATREN